MISKIKKHKMFIKDILLNSFSFAIYIFSQQIIFMPIMGKLLPENTFANFIIFISIFSIISNSFGCELGVVRQIKEDNNSSQYNYIMRWLLGSVLIVSIICLSFLKFSILETLLLSIVVSLANIRLYICSCFRMKKYFKGVMVQNILYLIGLLFGLGLFLKFKIIWIPSLIAELVSLSYSLIKSDFTLFSKKVKVEKKTLVAFKDYSIN